MSLFLDLLTIPVGLIGLYAWVRFTINFSENHKAKIAQMEASE